MTSLIADFTKMYLNLTNIIFHNITTTQITLCIYSFSFKEKAPINLVVVSGFESWTTG
jgi:hypothetical protein